MYELKGLVKVYNGKKYKMVSYNNDKGLITFTTSAKSNKYGELKRTGKIKTNLKGQLDEYPVMIIEDPKIVQDMFKALKTSKTIPFFIPRKHKIIVQYTIK